MNRIGGENSHRKRKENNIEINEQEVEVRNPKNVQKNRKVPKKEITRKEFTKKSKKKTSRFKRFIRKLLLILILICIILSLFYIRIMSNKKEKKFLMLVLL